MMSVDPSWHGQNLFCRSLALAPTAIGNLLRQSSKNQLLPTRHPTGEQQEFGSTVAPLFFCFYEILQAFYFNERANYFKVWLSTANLSVAVVELLFW